MGGAVVVCSLKLNDEYCLSLIHVAISVISVLSLSFFPESWIGYFITVSRVIDKYKFGTMNISAWI